MSAGLKSFVFASKLKGVPLRITIGSTDVWVIDRAREEAKRLQTLIDQGIDPREVTREKAKVKADAEQAKESRKRYTLEALCTAYVDYLRAGGKIKSATDTKSAFKVHVIAAWPDYANTPAREISGNQIAAIVRKVLETGKDRTAGILRNYLTAAFNAARRAPFDPKLPSALIAFEITANPAELVPTIPVNRGNRALSIDELKGYMAELGDDTAGLALQVALFSGGQRIAQLLRTKVSDFDQETNTLRLWDIKGKRAHPREHLIPLGPKATSIVKSLIGKRTSAVDSVFGIQEQTAGNRVTKISAAMGGATFTLRDIRRTVETQLAGMGIHKDTRAQLLSHGISGVQAAHYDRYEYFTEKQNALIAWEQRLDEIAKDLRGKNVIQLAQSA